MFDHPCQSSFLWTRDFLQLQQSTARSIPSMLINAVLKAGRADNPIDTGHRDPRHQDQTQSGHLVCFRRILVLIGVYAGFRYRCIPTFLPNPGHAAPDSANSAGSRPRHLIISPNSTGTYYFPLCLRSTMLSTAKRYEHSTHDGRLKL